MDTMWEGRGVEVPEVDGLLIGNVPEVKGHKVFAAGSLFDHGKALQEAWANVEWRFCEGQDPQGRRVNHNLLVKNPVDVLVVNALRFEKKFPVGQDPCATWLSLVARTRRPPHAVVEVWRSRFSVHEEGPISKGAVTRWRKMGYGTTSRLGRSRGRSRPRILAAHAK